MLILGFQRIILSMPRRVFKPDADYDSARPMRLSFYALANFPVSNHLDLIINGLYAKQEAYSEKVVNAQIKFYLGRNQSAAFYVGGGYRLDDALYPMVALEVGNLYGAFSYDYTISDFDSVNDGRGGPELSLRYIIANIPKGVDKPCPLY